MNTKKVFNIILFFILIVLLASCQNEVNIIWPEERDKDTVSISITTEYPHSREDIVYPGEEVTFDSRSSSVKHVLDNTKTIVWTVTQVSDGERFLDSEYTDSGVTSIEKVFKNEGTYKIRADLYDSKEFQSAGVGAPLLDTDEYEITVEAIDFTIETEVIDEKVIQFTPRILNPEIGPAYTELRIYFGDNTIEVQEEKDLASITHSYMADGIYNVTAELIYKSVDYNSVIAEADTSVRVKGALYIVAPSGPLTTDTVYMFQAHQVKDLPSASAYEWDFGDGTVAKIPYTNEVSHLFIKPGSYVVSVDVLDSEVMGVNILASTYIPVEVVESANFIDELHEMNKFDLDFSVQCDYEYNKYGLFQWNWDSYGELIWDGPNFSMEWSKDGHTEHMMGRVSENGSVIEHLMIRHEFMDFNRINQWFELVIHNLPFSLDEAPDRFTASERGEALDNVVIYFNSQITEGYHWTKDAELIIRFEKE